MPLLRWQVLATSAGTVALCQRPDGQSHQDVIEKVVLDARFTDVDEVVIREPVFMDTPTELEPMEFRRLRGVPVRLLGTQDYAHVLGANINSAASSSALRLDSSHIKELQQAELRYFAKEHGAVLPRISSGFYKTPSGRFVRRFLRAGHTQSSQAVLDAYFFWLLPSLKGKSAIAADTWSISSITLNACRRAAQYDHSNLSTKFHILPHAASGKDTMLVLAEAMQAENALFIMSVSHSGDAIRRVEEAFDRLPFRTGTLECVVLYDVGETPDPRSLCRLREAYNEDFMHVAEPELGNPVVDIHKYSLFPSNFVDHRLEPLAKHGAAICEFVQEFGTGKLSVHRRAESLAGARHSAFWIDSAALSNEPTFKGRFREAIAGCDPDPSLILYYPHNAGHLLAALASEIYPNAILWPYPTLDTLSNDDRALLDAASAILVLDDTYVTGRRILNYQRQLRELRYPGVIHYRVGVARPEDLDEWRRRKARLECSLRDVRNKTNTAAAAVELALPNWDTDTCPWCAEYQMYERYVRTIGPLPTQYEARYNELSSQQDVISPFLPGLEGEIGTGSIFCPDGTDTNSACCSVSSAIQNMRTMPAAIKLGPRRYPIASVLDHSKFLPGHFEDPILKAAILRGCIVDELALSNRNDEKKRGDDAIKTVKEWVGKVGFEGLLREMCLAYHAGKLPYYIGPQLRSFLSDDERPFWDNVHAWRSAD